MFEEKTANTFVDQIPCSSFSRRDFLQFNDFVILFSKKKKSSGDDFCLILPESLAIANELHGVPRGSRDGASRERGVHPILT